MITVRFGSGHAPVRVPAGAALPAHLTASNSPLLFGCRTGLCGTCLVHLAPADAADPADADERELLDVLEAGDGARLACQLRLRADAVLSVPG